MPRRDDIDAVMVIGAGPITIGQACEFDYSGTQACVALRAEGYRVVLVNSNPATIMTDPEIADATYVEPVTPDIVARILERERQRHPGERMALLPTMGGQTGLNVALALQRDGVLERLGVEMIGARADVIRKAEDRQLFQQAMTAIGLECPRSRQVSSLAEALETLPEIGLPAIIRPSFTMGGTGGGIARTEEEYRRIVTGGLRASPEATVLVEESVLGWKEFEMEVVRDVRDNCIIVCSIENIDPMGIHTGDSITIAPALTLTDKEYQVMRSAAIAVLREIGVETGGSNVQFAINPEDGRMVVIEMNPRVSRSSALASKATGFPIAKVAARLAVGYTLDELPNDVTGGATPASFEPAIDYIVTKIPRFTFEKFAGAERLLTTSMKSVGEAMAIGGSFMESFQKALRSTETGLTGLDEVPLDGVAADGAVDRAKLLAGLERLEPDRLLKVAQAFRHGITMAEAAAATRIDPWFLRQIHQLVEMENSLRAEGLPSDAPALLRLKRAGFSDARLARLTGLDEAAVAARRAAADVRPVYRRIDSCAAEFPSATAYMYGCFSGDGVTPPACEADVSRRRKAVILGGGPNRIGQGIEFDYCCVHAAGAFSAAGLESIMVNCNPETVSTDYDRSDRLYFEPLTAEDVIALCHKEAASGELLGVAVQFGGQTPLKLAPALEKAGIPILGTTPDAIDLAEDRERFNALLNRLGLRQPPGATAGSAEAAMAVAAGIGYPVVVRPSHVLGGRAMEIVADAAALTRYMNEVRPPEGGAILVDRYLEDAVEVDVDALADGENVYVAGVLEHVERAGVHSGDSACCLPPHSLPPEIIAEIQRQTVALALGLGVRGLMNVQFAVQDGAVFILEANPRASRTVPFVAKATGVPLAALAARIMAGERLRDLPLPRADKLPGGFAVKEAVLPFSRFPGVDVLLGPEMRATGEVMGLADDFETALAKAMLGAGFAIPESGQILVAAGAQLPEPLLEAARILAGEGYALVATPTAARGLREAGLPAITPDDASTADNALLDLLEKGEVRLLFNAGARDGPDEDGRALRRTALERGIPYCTTVAGFQAAARAIRAWRQGDTRVVPLQERTAGLHDHDTH